jgi:hypothetical protein
MCAPARPSSRRAGWLLLILGLLAGEVAAAPPPATTLVGPTGIIQGSTVAFTWEGVDGATFYYLQINDATASPRLTRWYPAGQACPAASATCTVILTIGLATGNATWWVQTWNVDGYGPWSAGIAFTVTYPAPVWGVALGPDRFQLVLGGAAVLDRETGLVWERSPSTVDRPWAHHVDLCPETVIGGRGGWRVPTVDEAGGLVGTGLPAGHPFGASSSDPYWTASSLRSDQTFAFVFVPTSAVGGGISKTINARGWCVRGGQHLVD